MGGLQAHIAEHLGFKYRKDIEQRVGAPLPAPDSELSEEIEVNLARVVAEAGKQLTQANMKQAAQQQAMAKAKDPVMQMQQAEMQIKQSEVQRKAQKDAADAALDREKLNLEKTKVQIDAQEKGVRLQADKVKEDNKLDLELFKTTRKQ